MKDPVKRTWIIIIAVLLILCCCIMLIAGGLFGTAFYGINYAPNLMSVVQPTLENWLPTVTGLDMGGDGQVVPTPDIVREVVDPASYDTLQILEESIVPNSDLAELAQRLEGKGEIPATTISGPPQV
jgi:hypothetical protein